MTFNALFPQSRPIIGCIHLLPLPGAPAYDGAFQKVISTAIEEARIFQETGVHGIIIENFRDFPFYPDRLPAESIAAMTAVSLRVREVFERPIGINALRNDAHSALAIAGAIGGQFIRVNIHTGAALTDQGIIEGKAYETLRLRTALKTKVQIFADVDVKHAAPLAKRSIEMEAADTLQRGMADAVIVSGDHTGGVTQTDTLVRVKQSTESPILIGSGITLENLQNYMNLADGFIIGSYFKKDGNAMNIVEKNRVTAIMQKWNELVA